MYLPGARGFVFAVACALAAGPAWAQGAPADAAAQLSLTQIVEQVERHNQERAAELTEWKALRRYEVEYRGFATRVVAGMDVEASFDATTGKSFRIVSQSGSKMLCEKVLRRAIEGEQEAGQDKATTALTEANYRFRLAASDSLEGRPVYVLDVEPLTASKFLFRGRIWVDAADFAVVKMETEPAKNPSFWISRTLIHSTSAKTGGFWLPQHLRSETRVRIGGTAVLTIDYGSYAVVAKPGFLAAGR